MDAVRKLMVALTTLALITGCSGGGGDDSGTGVAGEHAAVVLRDTLGNPISMGSNTPYSPRHTCGACHDVDSIANGYHFQQGRTDAVGNVVCQDDYFGDGRTFIRSAGMYGKW
jgi:hypothetical protein